MTPQSFPCETASSALSALLDNELSHLERLEAVDHLAACANCRHFYRRARDLDGWMATLESDGQDEPVSETMWSRVTSATSKQEARPSRIWLSSLAAMTLLACSLWLMQTLNPSGPGAPALVELQLEEDRGQMTDQRFVALTTEVLRADRRYHHKMLEVMSTVADRTRLSEGTAGDTAQRTETREERRESRGSANSIQ